MGWGKNDYFTDKWLIVSMKHIAAILFLLLMHNVVTCAGSHARERRGTDSVSVNKWSLAIVSQINAAKDSLGLLGVASDATSSYDPAYDVPHPPNPPGDYAEFYFPHSGGTWPVFLGNRYASDITSPASPRWVALAGASFSSGTMTLSWDTTEISQLPEGYDLIMKDSSTSTLVTMRHQNSYSFTFSGTRIFVFWIDYSSTIFTVQPKWNLVSVPVTTTDYLKAHIFPTAISAAYSYSGSYKTETMLENGKGYWVKFGTPDVIAISGTALSTVDVPLVSGWNLIGSVDHEIPAPTGGTIISNCFGYNGAYTLESTLKPGKGYWVKSSGNSTITLGGSSIAGRAAGGNKTPGEATRLTFTDGAGNKQILFLASDDHAEVSSVVYELPPVPPDAGFDVRFSAQRYLEYYKESATDAQEFSLELRASQFPVTITMEGPNPTTRTTITERVGRNSTRVYTLERQESVILRNPEVRSLLLTIRPTTATAPDFRLSQNYPNPFNPATRISFFISSSSFVSVKVYDMSGREVETLVDGAKSPGSYDVSWDATRYAAGVYYCKFQDGKSAEVRKMVLVK